MYESPFIFSLVDEVAKEVAEGIDDFVMKATVNAGITVDKDELVKALAYDRGQYDKGYCDGYQAGKQDAMQILTELVGDSLKTVDCVDEIPTVDAEPVVRCGECMQRDEKTGWCDVVQDYISNTNWFCAGGERKDGADDAAD